ncbi:MAG: putative tellurite resistance protein B-like protein [Sediminicola sp.]|jgi:uncharacterized tellurite resistance protein B-like protein
MSFTDLFESGERNRNLAHFASILRIAAVDGVLNEEEEHKLKRFARKLNVTDTEYLEILKNPKKYPLSSQNSADKRLELMHDLFEMIFVDHDIDEDELHLLEKYAIGLGYTEELASKLIKRSIKIYSGGLAFEDYRLLLNRE